MSVEPSTEPLHPVYGLAIHGGAGTIDRSQMTSGEEQAYRDALDQALQVGYAVLDNGGTSLDAVEEVIVSLEDSPLFNAGRGAVFTHDGIHELDAAVMDGATGNAGAVAGVSSIQNPIRAARKVMTDSPHVLLVGRGAEAFAAQHGLQTQPPSYFRVEKRWQQLQRIREREGTQLDHGGGDDKHGTVGAVALDKHGNLAAGTSTGGMTNKRWGRVGDSPIIGAGTFAKNATCAVSATGHGEFFIRQAAAHSVSARMEYGGQSLHEAARAVIFEQLLPIGGDGGLVAIDAAGNVAMPFNTAGMYRGLKMSDGRKSVQIWNE